MNTSNRNKKPSILSKNPVKNIVLGILIMIIFLLGQSLMAQVGVGTTTPDASSALDVTSTEGGVLIPRMTQANRDNITSPATGLLIYQTDNTPGFYFYNGSAWIIIGTGNKNTLDEAYNEGGAGAGKNITANDGAVRIDGEDGFLVTGVFGSGSTIDTEVTGAGTRMFFSPSKSAFRIGSVFGSEWDNINIGDYSFAAGRGTVASGEHSVAIGQGAGASGITSVAFGSASAIGDYATAFGSSAAIGSRSTGLGNLTTASGENSTAMGYASMASGEASTTIGNGTIASGNASFAAGSNAEATGLSAIALGRQTDANGDFSTAIGFNTIAPSISETSIGSYNNTYTPLGSTTVFNAADQIFSVGNGFSNSSRSNALTIYKSGLMNINDEYDMPLTDGSANQIMATNGAGVLDFVNASSIFTDTNTTYDGTDFALSNQIFPVGQYVRGINAAGGLVSGTDQDNQNITGSGLSGTSLTIGIENGTSQIINLSSLQDGTGTDDQNLTSATLTGTTLNLGIENGTGTSVNLAALQDGTGTDNQNISGSGLSGTDLTIGIENGTNEVVDLSSLVTNDTDWYEEGTTTSPNSINDNIFTQGRVGIGDDTPDAPFDVNYSGSDTKAAIIDFSTTSNSIVVTPSDASAGLSVNTTASSPNRQLISGLFTMSGTMTDPNSISTGIGIFNNLTTLNDNYGLVIEIEGQSDVSYGIDNLVNSSSSTNFGVRHSVSGASNANYGGLFTSSGSGSTNYGIYANALGATNNWAGYFGNGNVYIQNLLEVDGSLNFTDGNEAAGYILESNATGDASWVNPNTVFQDNQTIETFSFNTTTNRLTLEIEDDGIGAQILDLTPLKEWTDVGASIYPADGIAEEVTIGTLTVGTGKLTIDANDMASGIDIEKSGNFFSQHFAIDNYINNQGGGASYGVRNILEGTGGANIRYAVYNEINGNSSGSSVSHYGIRNDITTTGTGSRYGSYNDISGAGTGNKYGTYNSIPSSAGGTHYGVYSDVQNTSGYAGYFLGRLSVGTTTSNNYILPTSRGTNGQVMTTNGTGIVTWQTPTSGDITAVTAGAGLTGGGTTGAITVTAAANNGLNVDAGANRIQLGGALTETTTLSNGTNALNINLNNTGDFNIQDAGTNKLTVLDNGDTVLGGNQYWRVANTSGSSDVLARLTDDGGDGLFQIYENNNISIHLNANGTSVFNEQGLDRDFRVESDDNTNMLRVDAGNNNVGIGGTPDVDFHVFHRTDGATGGFKLQNSNANNRFFKFFVSQSTTNPRLLLYADVLGETTSIGEFNATSGVYTATSDRRMKKDFKSLYFDWNNFMNLETLTYRYKKDPSDKNYIGLVAQDVEKIYPELINYVAEDDIYHMDYSGFGVIAVKAVQELKQEVDTLKKENAVLKAKLNKLELLEARLTALEASSKTINE